jgi:hypothetical protein
MCWDTVVQKYLVLYKIVRCCLKSGEVPLFLQNWGNLECEHSICRNHIGSCLQGMEENKMLFPAQCKGNIGLLWDVI